jgi:general secretion pathway protein F
MPTYHYTALTKAGQRKTGSLNGDSETQAKRLLKEQGLVPLKVGERHTTNGRFELWKQQLKTTDMAMILRQLATLLRSGLTLDDCLKLMAEQSESKRHAQLLRSWYGHIVEGDSLSGAMQNATTKVPDSVVASVAVGEETGHLDRVLLQLADEQEHLMANQQTLRSAMIYPALIILVAIGVLSFVMVKIVPQVVDIFAHQQQELPRVTRIVVGTSDFLINYGLYLLVALAVLFLGVRFWLTREANRLRWHKTLLKIPYIGRWLLLGDISDWCRGLGILLNSGVPAVAAMRISNATVNNRALKTKLETATEQVRQGSSIHHALVQQGGMPGFMLHMVGSGEASSELDAMLIRVADFYANTLKNATETLLKILNPVLLIIIALIVAAIMLGVLTPIMQMNQMI